MICRQGRQQIYRRCWFSTFPRKLWPQATLIDRVRLWQRIQLVLLLASTRTPALFQIRQGLCCLLGTTQTHIVCLKKQWLKIQERDFKDICKSLLPTTAPHIGKQRFWENWMCTHIQPLDCDRLSTDDSMSTQQASSVVLRLFHC